MDEEWISNQNRGFKLELTIIQGAGTGNNSVGIISFVKDFFSLQWHVQYRKCCIWTWTANNYTISRWRLGYSCITEKRRSYPVFMNRGNFDGANSLITATSNSNIETKTLHIIIIYTRNYSEFCIYNKCQNYSNLKWNMSSNPLSNTSLIFILVSEPQRKSWCAFHVEI